MTFSKKRFWLLALSAGAVIQTALNAGEFDRAGTITSDIGWLLSNTIYNLYIALTLIIVIIRRRLRPETKAAWWTLDLAAVSFLIVQGTKHLLRLPRPSGGLDGFPSGHTTFSFALAWLVLETYPKLAPLWFAMAVGIGWSRIEVHAHYPYQVLVGAPLGCLLGWLVTTRRDGIFFPRLLMRNRQKPGTNTVE